MIKLKIKKVIKLSVATLLSISFLTGCESKSGDVSGQSEDNTEPIVVWTQGNAIKEDAEAWGEENGVEVSVVVIPFADLQTKLKQQVSDSKTAPDVFAITKDFVKDWVDRDVTVNLAEEFADDANDYIDKTYKDLVELGMDSNGDLQAVTAEYPVGMMYYNREIAKNILGTDDPVEVAQAMDSIDKWPELYQKITDTYNGDVKMFGTMLSLNRMLYQQRNEPYVKDDVFTITKEMVDIFDINKEVYDNKMFIGENTETDAYFSAWNTDGFFIDFLPSWGFSSKVKPQIEGKEGEGKWGITTPTFVYNRGGSYFFITKNSKNIKNAWDLVKGISVETDQLAETQKRKNGFSSSKNANQVLVDSEYEEAMLGNQKIFEEYQKQADIQENETIDIVTKYDGDIESFFNEALMGYANGNVSKEDSIRNFGAQVTSAFPELSVEYNY